MSDEHLSDDVIARLKAVLREVEPRLPDGDRLVFGLRADGLSVSEISGILRQRPDWVDRRLVALTRRLRLIAGGDGLEFADDVSFWAGVECVLRTTTVLLTEDEIQGILDEVHGEQVIAEAVRGRLEQDVAEHIEELLHVSRDPSSTINTVIAAALPATEMDFETTSPDVYPWDPLWARAASHSNVIRDHGAWLSRMFYWTWVAIGVAFVPALVLRGHYLTAFVLLSFGMVLDLGDGSAFRYSSQFGQLGSASRATLYRCLSSHVVDMVLLNVWALRIFQLGHPALAWALSAMLNITLMGSFVRSAAFLRTGVERPRLIHERGLRMSALLVSLAAAAYFVDPRVLAFAPMASIVYGAWEITAVMQDVRRSPVVGTRLSVFVSRNERVELDEVLTVQPFRDEPERWRPTAQEV